MFKRLLQGKNKFEKTLSFLTLIALVAALGSLILVVITDAPAKFYYAVTFNFAILGVLLHIRYILIEEPEEYKTLRRDLSEIGVSEKEIDEYLKNKRYWDAYTKWVAFSIGLALIFVFVYIFIP